MEFDNVWVYIHDGSPKTKKDMVYTTMGGSSKISVMVYAHFGGSHKLKVRPFTLVLYLIVKSITQKVKMN